MIALATPDYEAPPDGLAVWLARWEVARRYGDRRRRRRALGSRKLCAGALRPPLGPVDDCSWIYTVAANGVLGIWREHVASPAFYRQSEPGRLTAITLTHGRPFLVLTGSDDGYRFIPLPDPRPFYGVKDIWLDITRSAENRLEQETD